MITLPNQNQLLNDSIDEIGEASRYEHLNNAVKKLFLVDAGLAFNSPYPPLLRPQRDVDLFLSFDFSQRFDDKTPPFFELLLAEEWAALNNIPFPPIKKEVNWYIC